jgi:hypothetical protein
MMSHAHASMTTVQASRFSKKLISSAPAQLSPGRYLS